MLQHPTTPGLPTIPQTNNTIKRPALQWGAGFFIIYAPELEGFLGVCPGSGQTEASASLVATKLKRTGQSRAEATKERPLTDPGAKANSARSRLKWKLPKKTPAPLFYPGQVVFLFIQLVVTFPLLLQQFEQIFLLLFAIVPLDEILQVAFR